MPYIHATDTALLWAVTQADAVLAHGLTEPGGLTLTGEDKAAHSLVLEGTYSSTLGTGLPIRAQANFSVEDLEYVQ